MKELIGKMLKDKYPKGLSYEYTKEEMTGYMMALNDIKEQLSFFWAVGQSEQYCEPNCDNRYALNDGFSYCPDCGKELG